MVVVQFVERVIVLADEAFGGAVRPLVGALLAIGTIHLVAYRQFVVSGNSASMLFC